MKNTKFIKHFFFGSAQYFVSDGKGDEVLLQVNYKGNTFAIKTLGKTQNEHFREELKGFAKDLLRRKHKTNFAKQ